MTNRHYKTLHLCAGVWYSCLCDTKTWHWRFLPVNRPWDWAVMWYWIGAWITYTRGYLIQLCRLYRRWFRYCYRYGITLLYLWHSAPKLFVFLHVKRFSSEAPNICLPSFSGFHFSLFTSLGFPQFSSCFFHFFPNFKTKTGAVCARQFNSSFSDFKSISLVLPKTPFSNSN